MRHPYHLLSSSSKSAERFEEIVSGNGTMGKHILFGVASNAYKCQPALFSLFIMTCVRLGMRRFYHYCSKFTVQIFRKKSSAPPT